MIGSLPTRTLPPYSPRGTPGRRLLAAVLRAASRALTRLARYVASAERRSPYICATVLEFYAEAGAPEGALYVDGQLVGHLSGVTRL